MSYLEKVRQLLKDIKEVYEDNKLSWEVKHEFIFHLWSQKPDILHLEWYNPDSNYDEEVRSFYHALEEKYGSLLD